MAKVAYEDISERVNLDHTKGAGISAGPATCAEFSYDYHSPCLSISYYGIYWACVEAPRISALPTYFGDEQTTLVEGNYC